MLFDGLGLAPEQSEQFALAARANLVASKPLAEARVRHNLPAAQTSFVGRTPEVARLRQLLDPLTPPDRKTRLITLTGAGGCGKTRLAIEVARQVQTDFADGVWLADLSTIADTTLVPTVVLTAIGGRESSDETPLEGLLRRVQGRKSLLILETAST